MSKKFNHSVIRIKNSEGEYDSLTALRGQNSYELAVKAGFTGSEEEWLSSMIGDGWVGAYQTLDATVKELDAHVKTVEANKVSATPITVTIEPSNWDSATNTAAMSVSGVTADNTIIVSPADESYGVWGECLIRAASQSMGAVTFRCDSVPDSNVIVNICIFE